MDLDANAGGGAERGDQGDGPRDKPSARKVRNQKNRRRLQDRKRMDDAYLRAAMASALNPEDASRESEVAAEAVRHLRRALHQSDPRCFVQRAYHQAAVETARMTEDIPREAATAAEAVAALRRALSEGAGDNPGTPQRVSQGTQTDGPMEEVNNTVVGAAETRSEETCSKETSSEETSSEETSSEANEDMEPVAHDERTYCCMV